MSERPVITLLTDFGSDGAYAAAMKGVILSILPDARIVDITHEIPPHDIRAGAFVLMSAYRQFPRGTIHVAVVDPGVGGDRSAVLAVTPDHVFIAPDNGLLSYVLDRETLTDCRTITAGRYMRHPVSATFHGRDIFAPAAAYLAGGVAPAAFGGAISSLTRLEPSVPELLDDRLLLVPVVHVDTFGNVILGAEREEIERIQRETGAGSLVCVLEVPGMDGTIEIVETRKTYDGAERGRPFFLFGSSGHLEIALNRSSAAAMTGLRPGSILEIRLL